MKKLSEEIVEWSNQSLEPAYKKILEYPKNPIAWWIYQLFYIWTLIMYKDIEKLKSYQESFKKWNKLFFFPMISQEMIDIAVKLVENKT